MVQGGCSFGYKPSHVYTKRAFPFELGFSITVHKAMGKTIDKVILALSNRPNRFSQIDYHGFYVAMSRVRRGENIRILINWGVESESLDYIFELVMPLNIKHYFDGFERCEDIMCRWNRNRTYDSLLRTEGKQLHPNLQVKGKPKEKSEESNDFSSK